MAFRKNLFRADSPDFSVEIPSNEADEYRRADGFVPIEEYARRFGDKVKPQQFEIGTWFGFRIIVPPPPLVLAARAAREKLNALGTE